MPEHGRCLFRFLAVNLEVAVLGEADNRLWMGFLDGIVGSLRFKRQYCQAFRSRHAGRQACECVSSILPFFAWKFVFEALTAENHVKLSRVLRQR